MGEWYRLSLALASIVPIVELFGGGLIIVSGFINGTLGNIFIHWSANLIAVYIVVTFSLTHQDWLITTNRIYELI
jgi:hypothetical protein